VECESFVLWDGCVVGVWGGVWSGGGRGGGRRGGGGGGWGGVRGVVEQCLNFLALGSWVVLDLSDSPNLDACPWKPTTSLSSLIHRFVCRRRGRTRRVGIDSAWTTSQVAQKTDQVVMMDRLGELTLRLTCPLLGEPVLHITLISTSLGPTL